MFRAFFPPPRFMPCGKHMKGSFPLFQRAGAFSFFFFFAKFIRGEQHKRAAALHRKDDLPFEHIQTNPGPINLWREGRKGEEPPPPPTHCGSAHFREHSRLLKTPIQIAKSFFPLFFLFALNSPDPRPACPLSKSAVDTHTRARTRTHQGGKRDVVAFWPCQVRFATKAKGKGGREEGKRGGGGGILSCSQLLYRTDRHRLSPSVLSCDVMSQKELLQRGFAC